jgi:hypothetical protein
LIQIIKRVDRALKGAVRIKNFNELFVGRQSGLGLTDLPPLEVGIDGSRMSVVSVTEQVLNKKKNSSEEGRDSSLSKA